MEILFLRYYSLQGEEKSEFQTAHQTALTPVAATFGSDQDRMDRSAFQDSYKAKLVELGLLTPTYHMTGRRGMPPEYDSSGSPRITGHEITRLGRLLVERIQLPKPGP